MFEKIVIVTKKTALEELINKFNTKAQAKFYIEQNEMIFREKQKQIVQQNISPKKKKKQSNQIVQQTIDDSTISTPNIKSFQQYEEEHNSYQKALEEIQKIMPQDIKYQYLEREFLPNFIFGEKDLVITIGPDGLVINTAKYLNDQPIFAINPDPRNIDGILLPFKIEEVKNELYKILEGNFKKTNISMAKAELDDGQILYGVNDIFIGARSHVSFRYKIEFLGEEERQCSSGIIVSTGAGSTGWLKSIIMGSTKITKDFLNIQSINTEVNPRFEWDSDFLYFSVREPFESKTSETNLVFGRIKRNQYLTVTSYMPENGVIFSDGIEKDFLTFNSGKIATISLADKKAVLIIK